MISQKYIHIVYIDGLIGSGKTTTLESLSRDKKNVIIEDPYNNPYFIKDYYTKRRNVFLFQRHNILSKIEKIKKFIKNNESGMLFVEISPFMDIYVFSRWHFLHGNISEIEYTELIKIEKDFGEYLHKTLMYVPLLKFIKTSPEVCLENIKKRARPEETSIDINYLKELEKLYHSEK
jgi:deoxyadenosine/deoxycytidine kinase